MVFCDQDHFFFQGRQLRFLIAPVAFIQILHRILEGAGGVQEFELLSEEVVLILQVDDLLHQLFPIFILRSHFHIIQFLDG